VNRAQPAIADDPALVTNLQQPINHDKPSWKLTPVLRKQPA
jgi:hypothetical protein